MELFSYVLSLGTTFYLHLLTQFVSPQCKIEVKNQNMTCYDYRVDDSKMASEGTLECDALTNNPVLQDIKGAIARILRSLRGKSKQDIIETLITEIELEDINECRSNLFNVACGLYDEQLEDRGQPAGKAKLELTNETWRYCC